MTTLAPSATSIRALAPPMLRAPPLMRTTLSATRPMAGDGTVNQPKVEHVPLGEPMTIRVAQVSTGNAGKLTLRQLIDDDRFDLVAVSTTSADKVGIDAGTLAGLGV